MNKLIFILSLAIGLGFATASIASGEIRSSDIQNINLGDSMKKVTKTLGEPKEVLAKELTPDGKEQVTWRYTLAPSRPRVGNPLSALGSFIYKPPRVDEHGFYHQGSLVGGIIGEDAGQAARIQQAYYNTPQGQADKARASAPPVPEICTIVFVDRKVTSVKKQEA